MCKASVRCRGEGGADRDGERSVRRKVEFEPDIRYRDGGMVESVKRKGYRPPEGLFIEKPHHKFGR